MVGSVGASGDEFGVVDAGQTPIDPDESAGLLPSWVRTRADLNTAESDNILEARRKVRRPGLDEVLDDAWLRALHKAMFGDVWSWAGKYRSTLKNLGVEPDRVAVAVRDLVGDAAVWIATERLLGDGNGHERAGAALSICARFHHQLTWIHPFPNGNGRHARAATDYLVDALDIGVRLSWGRGLGDDIVARANYVSALRRADRDRDDLGELVAFMRG